VIAHIRAVFVGDNVAIACIYCDYKNQIEQTVFGLLAGLLKQFVQDRPAISNHVRSLYECHFVHSTRPTPKEVTQALRAEIGTYSKVFIVVDALDECLEGNQRDLVTELGSLGSTVNLMVASRPLPLIQELFQHAKCLNISANNDDVRTYIRDRIPREHRLSRIIGTNRALEESIVNKIVANIAGMCVFQMHNLMSGD
jgi:hypothetical protein